MSAEENQLTNHTLKHMKAGLEQHMKFKRIKTSQAFAELKEWMLLNEKSDPMLHPMDKKLNPFVEKGGCYLS